MPSTTKARVRYALFNDGTYKEFWIPQDTPAGYDHIGTSIEEAVHDEKKDLSRVIVAKDYYYVSIEE